MSDYSKTTDFSAKDALASGDANKIISGTDIDTEFDAIQTSNNTKATLVVPATTSNLAGLTAGGDLEDSGFLFSGTGGEVTSTAAELSILDGVTADAAEINQLDGVTIYNLVVLDTPELIVSSSAVEDTWTTVNSSTLNTATASKAILRVDVTGTVTGTAITVDTFIRKTGSALPATSIAKVASSSSAASSSAALLADTTSEVVVNLDTSYDFDWYSQTNAGTMTTSITLVGYYI